MESLEQKRDRSLRGSRGEALADALLSVNTEKSLYSGQTHHPGAAGEGLIDDIHTGWSFLPLTGQKKSVDLHSRFDERGVTFC